MPQPTVNDLTIAALETELKRTDLDPARRTELGERLKRFRARS